MMSARLVAAILVNASVALQAAESPLAETRGTLEKWVETRQLVSKTRGDWQSDKEMIEQSVLLFERELKSIREQTSKLDTNSVQVDKEREIADRQVAESEAGLAKAKEFAARFQARFARLAPRLPAPLQETLKPLFAKLPEDPAHTKMGAAEQVQVLVGMLNEVDKFNNAVTVFSEKRKNPKGEEVAVETLYVGLGAAYFVNDHGDFAGRGWPGTNGWEWGTKPELASAVREAIRIYRNEQPARFVALPVSIK